RPLARGEARWSFNGLRTPRGEPFISCRGEQRQVDSLGPIRSKAFELTTPQRRQEPVRACSALCKARFVPNRGRGLDPQVVLIPKPIKPAWPREYVPKSQYARIWYSRDSIPVLAILGRAAASKILSFASPIRGHYLEIGCGPGGLLPSLCNQAELVVGLDVNEEMIDDASALTRSMYGASCVIRGSAYSMPFRNSSFDGI